jgi:hypothetical protein
MMDVLIEFQKFPEEKDLVGSLLIAYGEIEFALFNLAAATLGGTVENAMKIFFRIRGESARIEVSDAVVRPPLKKVGLEPKWTNAIGPLRLCRRIRNQYAHCHWMIFQEKLWFIDFDGSAESNNEDAPAIMHLANKGLLRQQLDYFAYTIDWLIYLMDEYEKRIGKTTSHDRKEPKSVAAPLLYERPDAS